MRDLFVSHVRLGDKAGLTLAFLGETGQPGIGPPKLDWPKTREAQRVAIAIAPGIPSQTIGWSFCTVMSSVVAATGWPGKER